MRNDIDIHDYVRERRPISYVRLMYAAACDIAIIVRFCVNFTSYLTNVNIAHHINISLILTCGQMIFPDNTKFIFIGSVNLPTHFVECG